MYSTNDLIIVTSLITGGIMALILWYMAGRHAVEKNGLWQRIESLQDDYRQMLMQKNTMEDRSYILLDKADAYEKIKSAITMSKHKRLPQLLVFMEEAMRRRVHDTASVLSMVAALDELNIYPAKRSVTVAKEVSRPRSTKKSRPKRNKPKQTDS